MRNCQVRFLGEGDTATCPLLPDKAQSRYRSFVIEGAGLDLHSCSVGGKYLYVRVPKIGLIKIRSHRHLPDGAILKQLQFVKKNDGWFVNLRLEDATVPVSSADKLFQLGTTRLEWMQCCMKMTTLPLLKG